MFHDEVYYKILDVATHNQYQALAALDTQVSDVVQSWSLIVPYLEVDRANAIDDGNPTDLHYNNLTLMYATEIH